MSSKNRAQRRAAKRTQGQRKEAQQAIKRANQKAWPYRLVQIPDEVLPEELPVDFVRAFRSRHYIVHEYVVVKNKLHRLAVARVSYERLEDRLVDTIPWDDLMRIKSDCGYMDACAVEVFPPIDRNINVGDMRHLWVYVDGAVPYFVWKKEDFEEPVPEIVKPQMQRREEPPPRPPEPPPVQAQEPPPAIQNTIVIDGVTYVAQKPTPPRFIEKDGVRYVIADDPEPGMTMATSMPHHPPQPVQHARIGRSLPPEELIRPVMPRDPARAPSGPVSGPEAQPLLGIEADYDEVEDFVTGTGEE